jgi:molybdate transport system regulatory protein
MATRLTIRLDFDSGGRLGVGKIALLESIEKTGSISAAARAQSMSYRRAWLLMDELNMLFSPPLVVTHQGGLRGGGVLRSPTRAGGSSPSIARPRPRCAPSPASK